MDTLHAALAHSLQTELHSTLERTLTLTTLRSRPHRTFTLFPFSADPLVHAVHKRDLLVLLSDTLLTGEVVPVYGLEGSLYTIASTQTTLFYLSKLDTTGLSPYPTPTSTLTRKIVSHILTHAPSNCSKHVRIHTFARASREGQYLFPSSIDNAPGGSGDGAKEGFRGKRVLGDAQLIKWWKSAFSGAVQDSAEQENTAKDQLSCFVTLPGWDELESLPFLGPLSSSTFPAWRYSHSYNDLTPVVPPSTSLPALSCLIPAFSDDPKARYLHSLASSTVSPAGQEGDWDDEMADVQGLSAGRRKVQEDDRIRESKRLDSTNVEDFWIGMGGRQECSDGRVGAFFVVAKESQEQAYNAETPASTLGFDVPRNVWIQLWSQFHNVDYSSHSKAGAAHAAWLNNVKAVLASESSNSDSANAGQAETFEQGFTNNVSTVFTIKVRNADKGPKRSLDPHDGHSRANPANQAQSRDPAVSTSTVTILQVKKKKKKS